MTQTFPPDFVFGVATSSYQIEGATDVDGRGESIWDRLAKTPGAIDDGSDGSMACDHYHRYPEDIALMNALGVGGYRFSIAWPRVIPDGRGRIEERGLAFYDRLVDALLAAGVEPTVTLYHWDLPQALEDVGGWRNRETVDAFLRYTDVVARRLGDRVKRWITHNEIWCIATLGYEQGRHAPGARDPRGAIAARHHLLLSHGLAVPIIRRAVPGAQVGITHNLQPVVPASDSPADRDFARRVDGDFNRWLMDPLVGKGYPMDIVRDHIAYGHLDAHGTMPWIKDGDLEHIAAPIDFLGLNYYTRVVARAPEEGNAPRRIPEPPADLVTSMGWEVYPPGLIELLRRIQREWPQRAIYITECGGAWPDQRDTDGRVRDTSRQRFLENHFAMCRVALDEGIPVHGFFVWSLLDNFEWSHGYEKRFGLVWVDYDTQRRTIKDSGHWYSRLTRSRTLDPGLIEAARTRVTS